MYVPARPGRTSALNARKVATRPGDPTLGRRVAVKTILKSVARDEETERAYSERFVREAKAVGRLNHPNIVQVHDFGEENEIAYLVMEFIQGRELRSYSEGNERRRRNLPE